MTTIILIVAASLISYAIAAYRNWYAGREFGERVRDACVCNQLAHDAEDRGFMVIESDDEGYESSYRWKTPEEFIADYNAELQDARKSC